MAAAPKEGPRPWVKFWVKKLHDHRFLRLNEIERYRYVGIYLCHAQGLHDYYQNDPTELLKSISVQLGVDAGQLHDSILRMQVLKLVDHELRITDWGSEQAPYVKDPTAAERQRRHRERKKALPAPDSAQPYGYSQKSMSRGHAVTSRVRHGEEEDACSSSFLKIKTTTTEAQAELIWPLWFDEGQRAVVARWMDGLDQVLQQQLLDQFQRKMEIKPPDSPMDWLLGAIKNAWDGKFVLTYGDEVAVRRARRAQEAADEAVARVAAAEAEKRKGKRRSELQERLNQMSDPEVREMLLRAYTSLLKPNVIDDWLEAGRPEDNTITPLARAAIAATDEDVLLQVESEA